MLDARTVFLLLFCFPPPPPPFLKEGISTECQVFPLFNALRWAKEHVKAWPWIKISLNKNAQRYLNTQRMIIDFKQKKPLKNGLKHRQGLFKHVCKDWIKKNL